MPKANKEVSLEVDPLAEEALAEDDVELLAPEKFEGIDDNSPHLVFLMPGIRTDGWWAQEARHEGLLWDGREVHFVPVRGNGGSTGRLSSLNLFTRIGLQSYRESFIEQISTTISNKDYASINVFAHSMGSALFADIVDSLSERCFSSGKKIRTIAFLGSVCHRKHSQKLSKCSDRFINDVGVNDYLPFIASTVRPGCYSDVGFAGFLDAYTLDRFFQHNHATCVSFEHIRDELVPLISSTEVTPLGSPRAVPRHYNRFVYLRRFIQIFPIIIILILIFNYIL